MTTQLQRALAKHLHNDTPGPEQQADQGFRHSPTRDGGLPPPPPTLRQTAGHRPAARRSPTLPSPDRTSRNTPSRGNANRVGGAYREDTELPADDLPYASLEAIFDDIESTLNAGKVPVDVEYDNEFGFARSYIWNGPELPVDGGFILTVTAFDSDPPPGDPLLLQESVDALVRWENSGLTDYDYTFTRTRFCPEEFVGPYGVEVRDGR
jgi:hypothetical protein